MKIGDDNSDPVDDDLGDAGDDIHVDDSFGSNVISLSYDNNGNLTNDGIHKYEYDAWNRLAEVIRTDGTDETTIATYEYYADNRHSEKIVQNCGAEEVANDGGNTTVRFYYDTGWHIVETRNGSNQTTCQYLWGTQYTDELIWIDDNGDPTIDNDCLDSAGSERYTYHSDANFRVVMLIDESADVVPHAVIRVAIRDTRGRTREFGFSVRNVSRRQRRLIGGSCPAQLSTKPLMRRAETALRLRSDSAMMPGKWMPSASTSAEFHHRVGGRDGADAYEIAGTDLVSEERFAVAACDLGLHFNYTFAAVFGRMKPVSL